MSLHDDCEELQTIHLFILFIMYDALYAFQASIMRAQYVTWYGPHKMTSQLMYTQNGLSCLLPYQLAVHR